jgi:tryptophan-rich sensory protein
VAHDENSAARHLNVLVVAVLLASVVHFSDNAVRFARFPEPRWISSPHVVMIVWLAITPLLLGGWWLAHRRRFRGARIALQLYAGASLLVLGHYAYPAPAPLTLSMHAGIALNAIAALVLLLATPTILHRMRR